MKFLRLPKINVNYIRELYYTPESIVHPAKMNLPLCNWILDKYVKDGDVVLDPMCGIGTTLVEGMRKHPNATFIGVELEQKFCELAKGNVAKTTIYAATDLFKPKMAKAIIIQGDARKLPLRKADAIVTSPSYGGAEVVQEGELNKWQNKKERVRKAEDTFKSEDNLGILKYGKIDKIVTSPPFREVEHKRTEGETAFKGYNYGTKERVSAENPENIAKVCEKNYGKIDKIISSPPFAGNKGGLKSAEGFRYGEDEVGKRMMGGIKGGTGDNPNNLDNAPYDTGEKTYLSEMFKVYKQCNEVLKFDGLMILVTKNFVRKGKQVRLDEDTIALCESVGFKLIRRHFRKLTGESFWRILYRQKWEEKYPNKPCPLPEWEDVLVFKKVTENGIPF